MMIVQEQKTFYVCGYTSYMIDRYEEVNLSSSKQLFLHTTRIPYEIRLFLHLKSV
jgi:hypothetical protein